MSTNRQTIGRIVWILAIVSAMIYSFQNPQMFRSEGLADFLRNYNEQALWVYFILSCLRGLFLIPSTPFVFAGILLFPTERVLVFVISMIGVLLGSSIVYWFSEKLGFGDVLRKKHEHVYRKLKQKMERYGSPIVILWSFFPLVPTDLICCIAGTIRMPFTRFLLAVFVGEFVLLFTYIYTGTSIVPLLIESWAH